MPRARGTPRTREGAEPSGANTELSGASTKAGRLQRALLALYREHLAGGLLPTSGRFLWYELIDRGVVDKALARGHPGVRRGIDQDVTLALTRLREVGLVPRAHIVDETRDVRDYRGWPSVGAGMVALLDQIVLDPWIPGLAPLVLCESRSLAGVLAGLAEEYRCPIAATNGQAGGFLHTDLAPLIEGRPVLYLGDWDHRGGLIEANTRRVLEGYGAGEWERVALTEVQVRARGLSVAQKLDKAYKPARLYDAVETEALGQGEIVALLRQALEVRLPRSLGDVGAQERAERERLRRLLAP